MTRLPTQRLRSSDISCDCSRLANFYVRELTKHKMISFRDFMVESLTDKYDKTFLIKTFDEFMEYFASSQIRKNQLMTFCELTGLFADIDNYGTSAVSTTDDFYLLYKLAEQQNLGAPVVGEYKGSNKPVTIKHNKCGTRFDVVASKLSTVNGNIQCPCEYGKRFDKNINSDYLLSKFNKSNLPIKELLLDQSILAGIGNIYADEILFSTKINPFRKGNDISDEKYHEIFQASNQILNKAITLGGSTIHSFHPSEGVDGKFQETLLCYGKSGTPCPNCNTTLHKDFIGGRGTTFCPNCQIDKSLEKGIAITGPIGSGKSTVLNYFKEKGFITYSCDEMVHKLYEKPEISRKISQILNAPFDINNKKTTKLARKIMIDNPEIKKKIESYIYPILEKEMVLIIKNNEKPVFEVPTLFKAHLEYLFKTIIVIEISKEQQIKNLENRNDDINSSINLNKDYEIKKYQDKIKIVKADGNFNNLYAQIDEIIKSI